MADAYSADTSQNRGSELRLLSIVEALSVTGPLKPLIAFSSIARTGFLGSPPLLHFLMSTRRGSESASGRLDPLRVASEKAGLTFLAITEEGAFDPGVLPKYHRAIAAASPDIIETHDCKSHFLLFLLRTRHPDVRRRKWIAFHHGYTRTSWRVKVYQQLDRISLRQADRVVTLCSPFARDLSRRGVPPEKIAVVQNFVAPRPAPTEDEITRIRKELRIDSDECLILSVGRLSSEKAHSDLIVAFREVLERNPASRPRLVLVGDGPERQRLERLSAPLGSKVKFCGHLADPWILMNAADIFALPSHSEGSPLVILEAMAAHLPIVATSVGGIPAILTNETNALLVPAKSPGDFAAALLRLAGDEGIRGRLGRVAAGEVANFSPAAYATRLLSIYQQLLAS